MIVSTFSLLCKFGDIKYQHYISPLIEWRAQLPMHSVRTPQGGHDLRGSVWHAAVDSLSRSPTLGIQYGNSRGLGWGPLQLYCQPGRVWRSLVPLETIKGAPFISLHFWTWISASNLASKFYLLFLFGDLSAFNHLKGRMGVFILFSKRLK